MVSKVHMCTKGDTQDQITKREELKNSIGDEPEFVDTTTETRGLLPDSHSLGRSILCEVYCSAVIYFSNRENWALLQGHLAQGD
jgi:hypothetical protein